jgi:hypothetical protein
MNKLMVAILGNRNAGKSTTWTTLFERTVKTGKYLRRLYLNDTEYVEVFLVSGSPEEREKDVEEIITVEQPPIVLCSTQYRTDVIETYDYFKNNGYSLYIQWLNPGYSDGDFAYYDSLGLTERLLSYGAVVAIRNGKEKTDNRINEFRAFIYGWAKYRNLIRV